MIKKGSKKRLHKKLKSRVSEGDHVSGTSTHRKLQKIGTKGIDMQDIGQDSVMFTKELVSGAEYSDGADSDADSDSVTSLDDSSKVEVSTTSTGPPPYKKQRKSGLYREPTSQELGQLKETENLFQSSLLRLQITELLSEAQMKDHKRKVVDTYISHLSKILLELHPGIKYQLADQTWLKELGAECPVCLQPRSSKGVFQFLPPAAVKPVGSYPLNLALKPVPCVDLALRIPTECFQAKDHMNQRYLRKRALYLAVLASQLKSCDLVQDVSFQYHHGNHMRPVLIINPQESKEFTVQLHPYPEESVFKMNRFHIRKNNIRSAWHQGMEVQQIPGQTGTEAATPHYNTWVLQDLVQEANQGFLEHVFGTSEGVRQGLMLLKVWLHQRRLDQGRGCFSGYIMTMYVAYLLTKRKLNIMMSSYQILRNTLIHLSACDWCEGISLASDTQPDPNRPLLVDFQQAFDVVFVDPSGYLNLCCNMYKATLDRVRHEAVLGVELMSISSSDNFSSLLVTPVDFTIAFDQTFHVGSVVSPPAGLQKKADWTSSVMDLCGNHVHATVSQMVDVLYKGLGQRVQLVGVELQPCHKWAVHSTPPQPNDSTLTFGLLNNQDRVYSIVDKGPSADTSQAAGFREFWGERSELRRFQDGSICEAVVWKGTTMCEKRRIVARIVKHLLQRHIGIQKNNVSFVSHQLDSLLVLPKNKEIQTKSHSTGEEQLQHIHRCYDELAKILRNMKDLPLVIHTIQGVSPVFRYSEVFPPVATDPNIQFKSDVLDICVPLGTKRCPTWTPAISVLCLLEASGKWPDDAEAVKRVKSAFLLRISQLLEEQHKLSCQSSPFYLDVFKDGLVFRIQIGYMKELSLLKMVTTPEGMVKMVETPEAMELQQQLVNLPKLTSTLHGLHQHNNTFSCAVRLAKRWVSAHMLLEGYMKEETVELLVAYLYITPSPYTQPGSPLVGFLRFLRLICSYDWQTSPLIVNLNHSLERDDIAEIQRHFVKERSKLPPLFIATPKDKFASQWSRQGPSPPILQRLVLLARESLSVLLPQLQLMDQEQDLKQIFRPPLDQYDVVIHLNRMQLPRQHNAVDITTRTFLPRCTEYQRKNNTKFLPVVNYNPVQGYLQELRGSYAEMAMFFHDIYGGDMIAVIWKQSAFQPGFLKVSQLEGKMLVTSSLGVDSKLVTNVEAVLEGFRVLGKGLVRSIETRTDNWKI